MRIQLNSDSSIEHARVLTLFELCVVSINVIGLDPKLYVVSNGLLVLLLICVAWKCLGNKGVIKGGRGLVYLSLTFVYMIVSTLWAYNTKVATNQFKTQIQLIILFFAVYEIGMMYKSLVVSYIHAVYVSSYCMIIFAMIRYGGLNGYLSELSEIGRMGGGINGANGFGLVFANGCIAAFYYLLFMKKKSAWIGVLLFPMFALSSGSKKAFFFIILGLVTMLIYRYGFKRIYKVLFVALVILLLAYNLLQLPIFETMNSRLNQFIVGTNTSDIKRKQFIEDGIALIHGWRAVFGYGLHNFKVVTGNNVYSHNNYIETLVSFGVLGTIIYYLMYIRSVIGIYHNVQNNKIYVPMLIIIILTIVMEYGMVTMYSKEIWVLLGVSLAIADRKESLKEIKEVDDNGTNRSYSDL